MTVKTYLQATFLNLTLVLVGAVLSPIVVKSLHTAPVVHAQGSKATPPTQNQTTTQQRCDDTHFDCVSPGITTGTAGFGIVLANKIGCDQLQVNGYDPLKIDDALMGTLQRKGILLPGDISSIASAGKIEKPLRMKAVGLTEASHPSAEVKAVKTEKKR